jgi:hypothetical protein
MSQKEFFKLLSQFQNVQFDFSPYRRGKTNEIIDGKRFSPRSRINPAFSYPLQKYFTVKNREKPFERVQKCFPSV